jgi:hypothetical protein
VLSLAPSRCDSIAIDSRRRIRKVPSKAAGNCSKALLAAKSSNAAGDIGSHRFLARATNVCVLDSLCARVSPFLDAAPCASLGSSLFLILMINPAASGCDLTAHPYAPSLSQFTGVITRDGRRAGFCWDEKPRCVHGHRLKTRDPEQLRNLRQDDVVKCIHRGARDAAPCDTRQHVSLGTFGGSATMKGSGERFWFVVQVLDQHLRRIREEPMIFLERMVMLSCALPNVDHDMAGAIGGPFDDATGARGGHDE